MTDDIASRLAVIESIVTRLEYRLLGNGQPGALTTIDERLDNLETLEAKGRGVLWVVGLILGAIVSGGLAHVFKH